ncbi:MAG: LamG domain-containing protein, partial [Planctomycetes bacterium]|nr:LamG domain-containing protein [Planctomycetota bacterium]
MRKIVFLVIMVAITVAGVPRAIAAERLSVPGETRQNEAFSLLHEVYGAKLDSKDAGAVKGLVADLLEQAKDPSNDAAMRYVILKTAAEKAADIGDVATTLATTAQIVAQFKTKTGDIELRAIGNAAKAAKTAGEHGAVARDYINLVFQAIKADDYATAKEAAKLAGYASRKAKDKEVYDKTKDLGKIVKDAETSFFAARSAFKALKDNPDDPNANLAFGRYMCFVKGDWDTGLAHLEKGSDKTLAELAAKDFGDLDDPQEFLSLADAWWALGEKHGAPEQEELFGRARKYYAKALPHLSGLNKIKAEKRLEGCERNNEDDNGERYHFKSLVFYAPLEKEISRLSTGQTISAIGNVSYTEVDGIKCASFDGRSYLTFPTDTFPKSSCSISLWVKCVQLARKETGIFSCGKSIFMRRYTGNLVANSKAKEHDCAKQFQFRVWNHVVYTFSKENSSYYRIQVFVNGELHASFSHVENQSLYPVGFIGTECYYPQANALHGYMAGVRVYNRALSSSE